MLHIFKEGLFSTLNFLNSSVDTRKRGKRESTLAQAVPFSSPVFVFFASEPSCSSSRERLLVLVGAEADSSEGLLESREALQGHVLV